MSQPKKKSAMMLLILLGRKKTFLVLFCIFFSENFSTNLLPPGAVIDVTTEHKFHTANAKRQY